jgi:hypothetical protein
MLFNLIAGIAIGHAATLLYVSLFQKLIAQSSSAKIDFIPRLQCSEGRIKSPPALADGVKVAQVTLTHLV